jgi:hypothetical protein
MEMHSVTFFALLKEGVRQQAEDWKIQSSVAMAPEMDKRSWKDFMNKLDDMTIDTDILEVDNIDKLKQMFGQK